MSNGDRRMARDCGGYIGSHRLVDRRAALSMGPFAAAGLREMAGGVAVRLVALGRALVDRGVRAHRRRTALRELEALDDRMLKDIGLTRGAIPYEIDRALRGISRAGTTVMRSTRDAAREDGAVPVAREGTFGRAA
jgi:uncharacterized protein YjiS (DUF1127 family)